MSRFGDLLRRGMGKAIGAPLKAILPPFTIEGFESPMNPIPTVGEQTDEILAELGYSVEGIQGLHADREV